MFYEFHCDNEACSVENVEEFMNFEDYHIISCPNCGKPMRRLFTSHAFVIDFKPGFDVGLGEYCDTKRQRENFVSEKNLRRVLS